MSVLRTLLFTGCLAACGLAPAWAQNNSTGPAPASPVSDPLANNIVNTGAPPSVLNDGQANMKTVGSGDKKAKAVEVNNMSQDAARTGTLAVSPPGPGGAPMVDGQIQPISADMLALTPEEQQEMALQDARGKALDSTLKNALPLEPAEIQTVIKRYEDTTKAIETPFGNIEPKPEVKIETISLEPSATPPTIRLAPGHVTSLTMLDVSGQPWPVADVSWGGDFEIQAPEDGGHIIRISPLGGYKVGNMSLRLKDLTTPVTFTLKTQPDIVDYRFDARLPIPGPNALAPIIDTQYSGKAGSGSMMAVLDGVSPPGSEELGVTGVDGRTTAYQVAGQVYVRTPLSLLSPAWSEQATSADGMNVYVIPQTPVLLLSDAGRMVRANVGASTGPVPVGIAAGVAPMGGTTSAAAAALAATNSNNQTQTGAQ